MANVIVMNTKTKTFLKGGLDHPQMVSQYTQAHTIFIPRRKTIRLGMLMAIATAIGVSVDDLEILST